MKKYICSFILLLPFTLQAQCDDLNSPLSNEFISTYPKHAVNKERPSMTNTFDWTEKQWQVYHPFPSILHVNNSLPINLASPFYGTYVNLQMINFNNLPRQEHAKANLDFHPQDGWELLYKNNGINLTGQTITSFARRGPLFILYNRYTGKMRIFAASSVNLPQYFLTTLELRSSGDFNTSGLFSKYSGTINALDRASTTTKISQLSPGNFRYIFFVSEFNMNYDPCICQVKSGLDINFGYVNVAQFSGKGKLLGGAWDNYQSSPAYGKDFLIGFQEHNSSIGKGIINYQSVSDLLKQYQRPEPDLETQKFRLAVENALSQKGQGLENLLNKPAYKLPVNALQGTELKTDVSPWTLSKSFGLIGKNAQQFSMTFRPSLPIMPSISFIENNFSLSAQMQVVDLPRYYEYIVLPGSKDANTIHERFYPLYNEALGVFALLETPQIKYYSKVKSKIEVVGRARVAPKIEIDRLFQLDKNSIKYYFNPAAEVNLAKTRIYAALVINSNNCSAKNSTTYLNPISDTTFMTDFYPIEVLPQIAGYILGRPHLSCVPNSASLRLQIFYEFKPNRYGKVIKHYEVLDYTTDLINTDIKPQTSLPDKLPENILIYGLINSTLRTSIGNFDMTKDLTLKALNKITISGNLEGLSSSTNLNLVAGDSVIVANNVKIDKHVILKSDTFANVYGISKSRPVSVEDVKAFCSSSKYKANRSSNSRFARVSREIEGGKERNLNTSGTEAKETDTSADQNGTDISKVKIYPNPTTGLTHIALNFAEVQDVHITVYSILGLKVYEAKLKDIETTVYDLDLSEQPSGMYLVSIIGTKVSFDERVWVD